MRTIRNWTPEMAALEPQTWSRRGVLLGAGALAACGPAQRTAGKAGAAGGHVNVYTARHYDADKQIYALFKERTGIEVRALASNGDQLIERLRAEGEATEADLVVTVDAGVLWRLTEAGLLQGVTSPTLEAAAPARFHDPQGRWWAFSKRYRVIVYKKGAVDPAELASMDALTTPRFARQICARTSSNTYNLSMLAARIERDGRAKALAWARAVRGNFARDPQGSDTDQIKAVAAGECQAAIVNHYYFLRLKASGDAAERAIADEVGVVFPDQAGAGAHVNISGAGVSTYAKRKAAAVQLLEFFFTPEAQRAFQELNEEFPVRPDAELIPTLAEFGRFREEQVAFDALGRNQPEAAKVFEEAGWK
ncbi:MAG: extracellular solute-binding protein [Hyphomonadaceae bacterium]|nr:extracellular solute-binding protein [Hyphomonadaceae bacterium]